MKFFSANVLRSTIVASLTIFSLSQSSSASETRGTAKHDLVFFEAEKSCEAVIGIGLKEDDGHFIIEKVLEQSGASEAGLQVGAEIVAVDGIIVAGSSLEDITALIRGPIDTRVNLEMILDGHSKNKDVMRTKCIGSEL